MWKDKTKELIDGFDADAALLVKNLKTGEVLYSHNEEMVFPSCSVIKVPILLALMHEAENGRLNLSEAVRVSDENFIDGGLVKYMSREVSLPWIDHALFMITLSDNASTNHIITRLGFDLVNKRIRELGLKNTILQRKMLDFETRAKGIDNETNCTDMLILFEHLHKNADKNAESLHILKQQKLNSVLAGLLSSDDYEFAHKTGSLPHTLLDTGIMYLKDPIFVAFMSKNQKKQRDAYRLAHEIGLLIYEEFETGAGAIKIT